MRILFCRHHSMSSDLLEWATEEPCSHVAIDLEFIPIVMHSTLRKVHLSWAPNFYMKWQIVDYVLQKHNELDIYKALRKYEEASYDIRAYLYFAWRVALKKFFGIPLPLTNKWASPKDFLCTELVGTVVKVDRDLAMMTPWMLRNYLKGVK